jgi:SAM-dependent methyltransferase
MNQAKTLRLDLGSGPTPRPGYLGVDVNGDREAVVRSDVLEYLQQLPTDSVDDVVSFHFLEHVLDPGEILSEIAQVLRIGGEAFIVVPRFSNPYFYSDPTHRTPFGLYSMSYFVHDPILRRRMPQYSECLPLELTEVRLRFRAATNNRIASRIYRTLFGWIGKRPRLCEFYEFNPTGMVPCFQIEFRLRRLDGAKAAGLSKRDRPVADSTC